MSSIAINFIWDEIDHAPKPYHPIENENTGSGDECTFRTAANQSGGANIFKIYNHVLV